MEKYVEEMVPHRDIFIPPEDYSTCKYQTYGIRLFGVDEGGPVTVKLKCAAYSNAHLVTFLDYGVWVNDKPLYHDTLIHSRIVTSYSKDNECEQIVKDVFGKPWIPGVHEIIDNGFVIISTDEDVYDSFIVPTIVISPITRKGTIVTDLQHYELVKNCSALKKMEFIELNRKNP